MNTIRKCAICDADITFGFNYLCSDCWITYKDSMQEPWLQLLIASEQKERYYYRTTLDILSLDELLEKEND